MKDVGVLTELYRQDYLECHRSLYPGKAGQASLDEWEEKLGPIDFEAVISSLDSRGKSEVHLLMCVDHADPRPVVGYVLFERREKGQGKRRQRYCELVNIVVRSEHRGCGAGKVLFEAMCADLKQSTPAQADDLRLFVAKSNVGPMDWYRRLGFADAGWQSEDIGGVQVDFLRMIRRNL